MTVMSEPREIPEPLLHYSMSLVAEGAGEPRLAEWQEAGRYRIWASRSAPGDPPATVLELRADGLVELKGENYFLHPILAGQPHRIAHHFGYWQVSDADRIWIQIPRGKVWVYTLIWGGKSGVYREDRLFWICRKCGNRLAEKTIQAAAAEGFMKAQSAAVREFNADLPQRKCGKCGTAHPEAYGMDPRDDLPAERSARGLW